MACQRAGLRLGSSNLGLKFGQVCQVLSKPGPKLTGPMSTRPARHVEKLFNLSSPEKENL